jgi:hemin uptake protein HemP
MYAAVAARSLTSAMVPESLQAMQADEAKRYAADALTVESTDLLQGHKTVEIKHNGAVYRLQTTKLGKLILTK